MSTLTSIDRVALLSSWIKPSSDNEKNQQFCIDGRELNELAGTCWTPASPSGI